MKEIIRQARPEDAVEVAPLIVQAMESLASAFIGGGEIADAVPLFEYLFVQTENQYSHDNTLVLEENGEILGSITSYDGKHLIDYREKLVQYIEKKYGVSGLELENETQAGELYIDTLSVSPNAQGKGVGTALIKALIEKARKDGHSHVGLLVDLDNPNAKRLYERIGFVAAGEVILAKDVFEHMQVLL